MQLTPPTKALISEYCKRHARNGGGKLNDAIDKTFACLPDNAARAEVRVKVALLNTLYRTGIQNIDPVSELIVKRFKKCNSTPLSFDDAAKMVDKIALVRWKSKASGEEYERLNLSFASKFMHFHCKRQLPIYDNYVWRLITKYLCEAGYKCPTRRPRTFVEFLERYSLFREKYKLKAVSHYDLDKFLWMYGKELYEKA